MSYPWTRIIEHKWFNFGLDEYGNSIRNTIITKEYSKECKQEDEPFYPIANHRNLSLYKKYKTLAMSDEKVIFGGRLGEYKYYNMDQTIQSAIVLSEKLS